MRLKLEIQHVAFDVNATALISCAAFLLAVMLAFKNPWLLFPLQCYCLSSMKSQTAVAGSAPHLCNYLNFIIFYSTMIYLMAKLYPLAV